MKLPFIAPMSQLPSKHIAQRWAKAWRKALSPWPRHTTWGRLGRLSCLEVVLRWFSQVSGGILHIYFILFLFACEIPIILLTSTLFGWKISLRTGAAFCWGHFHSKASSGDDISSTVGSQEKKSLYTFVYYIYIIIYTGVFCGWWGDGHPRTLTKFGVKTCRVSGWSDFELVRPIDVDFVTDPRLAASD